jgi:hypothetical protein
MSLYVFYTLLKKDNLSNVTENPHFKIWVGLLLMWSCSFFYWAFIFYLDQDYLWWATTARAVWNILIYGWFGYSYYSLELNKQYLNKANC